MKANIDYAKLRRIVARGNELTDAANALATRHQQHVKYVQAVVKDANSVIRSEGVPLNIKAAGLEELLQIDDQTLLRAGLKRRDVQAAIEERELAREVGKKLASAQASASRHQNLVNNLNQYAGVPQ